MIITELQGLLICDGVGVGKTISAGFVAAYLATDARKPLVVASPVMLVDKWRGELSGKFGFDPRPVRNEEELRTAEDEVKYAEEGGLPVAYILAHSLLQNRNFSSELQPRLLIVDEIHNFRNPETISHKSLLRLCNHAENRIGLTATPINNDLSDLVSELNLLIPGASNLAIGATVNELWQSHNFKPLSAIMTRFEKGPLKIHFANRKIRTHRITYPDSYAKSIVAAVKELKGRAVGGGIMMDEITLYRLASSSPPAFEKATGADIDTGPSTDRKLQRFRQLVNAEPDQMIVFCEFRETVSYLERDLGSSKRVFSVTGDTPYSDRGQIIETFRRTPSALLIMTAVGSEGLDLQFCSRIVNYDLNWNPMVLEQRIGRVDRIGQEKQEVLVDNFLVVGSIDERVLAVVSKKISNISQTVFAPQPILDDEEVPQTSVIADDRVLFQENARGTDLMKALEQSSKIKLNDYSIIDLIPATYCNPEEIRRMGYHRVIPSWIPMIEESDWSRTIRDASNAFREVLSAYSNL